MTSSSQSQPCADASALAPDCRGPWTITPRTFMGVGVLPDNWDLHTLGPLVTCWNVGGIQATEDRARVVAAAPEMKEALLGLLNVIDAAGLLNLSLGVQLGPTVWYVKASDARDYALRILAKTEPTDGPKGQDGPDHSPGMNPDLPTHTQQGSDT